MALGLGFGERVVGQVTRLGMDTLRHGLQILTAFETGLPV